MAFQSTHWYHRSPDGTVTSRYDADLRVARKENLYPSVTTVEKQIRANGQLGQWITRETIKACCEYPKFDFEDMKDYVARIEKASGKIAETAADFGTRLHDALEWYPQIPMDPQIQPYFDKYAVWHEANILETISSETMLANPLIGVAGKMDKLVVHKDHGRVLVDFKGLDMETDIPTPSGWTKMKDLQVGHYVYGSTGNPVMVTAKSQTHHRKCYKIKFCDGSSIVCDNVHLWTVHHGRSGKENRITVNSDQLVDLVAKRSSGIHTFIRNSSPISGPNLQLPIDPYFLGAWLGDGTASEPKITLGDKKRLIADYIKLLGFDVREYKKDQFYIKNLRGVLVSNGLFGNKHVPPIYLRASFEQRLELLRGLMDTDGSWHKTRNHAQFVSTDKHLRDSVYELVCSLGWKASTHEHTATGFGVSTRAYTLCFTPFGHNPFKLNTFNRPKAQARINGTARCGKRLIKKIEPVESVPTQCIQVDAHDSLYLAGRQMVPTHNTQNVKAKPAFYDSWARQLGFYAQTYAMQFRCEVPRIMSIVLDSNEPKAPIAHLWSHEDQDKGWREFVCQAYLWMMDKDHWPAGKWDVSDVLNAPDLANDIPV